MRLQRGVGLQEERFLHQEMHRWGWQWWRRFHGLLNHKTLIKMWNFYQCIHRWLLNDFITQCLVNSSSFLKNLDLSSWLKGELRTVSNLSLERCCWLSSNLHRNVAKNFAKNVAKISLKMSLKISLKISLSRGLGAAIRNTLLSARISSLFNESFYPQLINH